MAVSRARLDKVTVTRLPDGPSNVGISLRASGQGLPTPWPGLCQATLTTFILRVVGIPSFTGWRHFFRAGLAKSLVPLQPSILQYVALLLTIQAKSDPDTTELRRRDRVSPCIGPSSQEQLQGRAHVNTSAGLGVRTLFECRT